MSGLEKIISKIDDDCRLRCEKIIKDAENKAASLIEKAELEAREKADEIIGGANKEAERITLLGRSSSEKQARQAILAKRVEIINSTVKKALDSLVAMKADEYFAVLTELCEKNALPGEGIMLLTAKDKERLPDGFAEALNKCLNGRLVKIGDGAADIDAGFILIYGDIEINCAFSALIDENIDTLRAVANEKLFS